MAKPELVDVLHALSDPIRLAIVRAIADAEGELSCNQMPVTISKSTASHHFKVLREAGVLDMRVEGTRRFHSIRRDELERRFPGLLDSVLNAARV